MQHSCAAIPCRIPIFHGMRAVALLSARAQLTVWLLQSMSKSGFRDWRHDGGQVFLHASLPCTMICAHGMNHEIEIRVWLPRELRRDADETHESCMGNQ